MADLGCWAVGRRLSQSVAILSLPCSLCTMPWAPALIGTKTIQELYYTTITQTRVAGPRLSEETTRVAGVGGRWGPTNALYTGAAQLVATALLLYY